MRDPHAHLDSDPGFVPTLGATRKVATQGQLRDRIGKIERGEIVVRGLPVETVLAGLRARLES